jgi:hypothetical protein
MIFFNDTFEFTITYSYTMNTLLMGLNQVYVHNVLLLGHYETNGKEAPSTTTPSSASSIFPCLAFIYPLVGQQLERA